LSCSRAAPCSCAVAGDELEIQAAEQEESWCEGVMFRTGRGFGNLKKKMVRGLGERVFEA
jgi:hypothetical protein